MSVTSLISKETFVSASRCENVELIREYLSQCKKYCVDLDVIFTWAADRGYIGVVKVLCEDGEVDIARENCLGLKRAAENGHFHVVKFLVEKLKLSNYSFQLDELDILFVMRTILNNHLQVVKFLVRHLLNDKALRELCLDCRHFQIAPFLKRSMSARTVCALHVWVAIIKKLDLTRWLIKCMMRFITMSQ